MNTKHTPEEDIVTKCNRMIFDFMGCVHSDNPDIDHWEMNNLAYHRDWNALMPVIERMEDLGFEVSLSKRQCQVFNASKDYPDSFIIDADFQETTLLNAWDAITAFVAWYKFQLKSV